MISNNRQSTIRSAVIVSLAGFLATSFVLADRDRDRLLELAVEKRNAIVVAVAADSAGYGCFIGEDGLAVFNLLSVTGKAPERYLTAGGRTLQAPTLRYVSPQFGVAIVKFDHAPKTWIEPSAEDIRVGLQVAILDAASARPLAIGPVSSRTMSTTANYLRPVYQPMFGIAAGLPAGRGEPPVVGSPVIDPKGRLLGIFHVASPTGIQTLLYAVSTEHWFTAIAEARRSKNAIPIPLPPNLDPFDPAGDHPDYVKAVLAAHQNHSDLAVKHVKRALQAHPKSRLLHSLHFEEANIAGRIDELIRLAEAIKPQAGGGEASWVNYYVFLSKARRRTGDHEGTGEALRQALEIAPKEDKNVREEYSKWLENDRQPEEALRYMREAVEASPDSILLLEKLRILLGRLNKWEAAEKVGDRIFELEDLYRSTSSRGPRE